MGVAILLRSCSPSATHQTSGCSSNTAHTGEKLALHLLFWFKKCQVLSVMRSKDGIILVLLCLWFTLLLVKSIKCCDL